tara:strand:+ start:689 stop:1000 length:312 start_codon:yes stop_codon:yes gene_type:complete
MSCINYIIPDTRSSKQNNQSDRDNPSNSKVSSIRVVPRAPNSTKRTKTSLRPGALAPGGVGVDVKHNSYDRYLARKKQCLIVKDRERKEKAVALNVPSCNYCH